MSAGGAGGDGTLLTMTTPLGEGVLQPVRLHAQEGISELFVFEVEMVSSTGGIDPDQLLYNPACVTLTPKIGAPRNFHGIVRSFRAGEKRGGAYGYRAELVPRLAFAGQTADCRMFWQVSALDVVQTLLGENGVTDVSVQVSGTVPKRDYICQYNETDLAFITRLMEEEGLFYFFTFTDSAHTLVIANANTAFTAIADPDVTVSTGTTIDVIHGWHRVAATAIGKVLLSDYDPLNPNVSLLKNTPTVLTAGGTAKRDVFRWPALSVDATVITSRTKFREEAAEAFATLFAGDGTNPEFLPGGKFTLQGTQDTPSGDAADYVIRRVVHEAVDEVHANTGKSTSYANDFSCFPAATTWRQPLVVPRPRMVGVTSALVIGEDNEEITTDANARIKVRMMWDREGQATNDSMIWVRVMQPWAGKSWGWQHLPRQGSEVMVAFVDGDIDRPIVIGGLYNAQQMPPFDLPAGKNKTGLRTRSTKQGGTANYSEFSFDDTKGSEMVLLHAEKDHTLSVENDHTVAIDHYQNVTIKHDQTGTIDHDQTWTIKHDQILTVDNNRTVTVKNDESITVQGKRTATITGDNATEVSSGNEKLTVDAGNITVTASAGKISHTAQGVIALQSQGDAVTIEADSNVKVTADSGAVTISAAQSIELKVGGNTLKIDSTGLALNGTMIKLAGSAMLDMKSPMTTLKGEGMLTLKGGIVMIN